MFVAERSRPWLPRFQLAPVRQKPLSARFSAPTASPACAENGGLPIAQSPPPALLSGSSHPSTGLLLCPPPSALPGNDLPASSVSPGQFGRVPLSAPSAPESSFSVSPKPAASPAPSCRSRLATA